MKHTRRQFIDGEFGQIHLRIAAPDAPKERPLACLHMSPKSGRLFANFVEQASDDRIVFAHDYPGYGESDPPPPEPPVSIADYATSLWNVVDVLQLGKIDLVGNHTGSEVAAEAAKQRPEQIGNIVMVSAPVLTPEELQQFVEMFVEIPLDDEGTRAGKIWENIVKFAGPGMTFEMMATSFAESWRGGEEYEAGHHAAFAYVPMFADTVKSLPHQINVINPNDEMAAATRRVAPYLNNGEVFEHPEWGHGFFEADTARAVAAVKAALKPRR